ncbi:hypothetical protein ACIBEJ_11290 [Nonomuraea sp. NPDC050790]|uniref:hypothetical protein n=1 Tax=Nonomuraea sp. NPDC050790 TaxID=3364371 RepID=UPI0037B0554C
MSRSRLFTPGRRLGWVFRDRRLLYRPFPEPPPERGAVPGELVRRAEDAVAAHRRTVRSAVRFFGIPAALLGVMAAVLTIAGSGGIVPVLQLGLGALVALPGAASIAVSAGRRAGAVRAVERVRRVADAEHERERAAWERRRGAHEMRQRELVERADEWGSAQAGGTRRLDVFGGNLWGWEALLTVHGASLLASQPVLVVDLSREVVCAELARLAAGLGTSVRFEVLPRDLESSRVGSDLEPWQLAEMLVEAMHGGVERAGDSRADRSADLRVLGALAGAMREVSVGGLVEGLRVLLGEDPPAGSVLSAAEREHIAHGLFTDGYVEHARPALARMEAFLHPLAGLGASRTGGGAAVLTCLALEGGGRSAGAELLTDLLTQWLVRRVDGLAGHVPAVVVAGADEVAAHHLERLSDVCERRGVPLTLLFRHLRETSLRMIGGGAVAFMRLGNHEEATRAADFVGRSHRFVLSQLTRTMGGNETHTRTETQGESATEGTSSSTSRSSTKTYREGLLPLPDLLNFSKGKTDTSGDSRSFTRTWSSAVAFAEGTNWSDAQARQRVYEYVVEPSTMQSLPEYALLLAEPTPGQGVRLTPTECNPAIITLPRVSVSQFT